LLLRVVSAEWVAFRSQRASTNRSIARLIDLDPLDAGCTAFSRAVTAAKQRRRGWPFGDAYAGSC